MTILDQIQTCLTAQKLTPTLHEERVSFWKKTAFGPLGHQVFVRDGKLVMSCGLAIPILDASLFRSVRDACRERETIARGRFVIATDPWGISLFIEEPADANQLCQQIERLQNEVQASFLITMVPCLSKRFQGLASANSENDGQEVSPPLEQAPERDSQHADDGGTEDDPVKKLRKHLGF
jgi:hypothetical protein